MSNFKKYVFILVMSLIMAYLMGFCILKLIEHKNRRIKLLLDQEFHKIA
jgi:hypothetical protein